MKLEKNIQTLIEISRYYGKDSEFVTAGGGNTSFKDENYIWIKSSGQSLATIDESGFVKLERRQLKNIAEKTYNNDPLVREHEVKKDLLKGLADPESCLRPSVETSLHEIIDFPYVVHLHPTVVNALLCGNHSRRVADELFGNKALYVPYTDPGYVLFKEVAEKLSGYVQKYGSQPAIILLENHGVFVGGNSVEEIKNTYTDIIDIIQKRIETPIVQEPIPIPSLASEVLPALRMILSEESRAIIATRHNQLIAHFYQNETSFRKIAHPFTPDTVIYCKSRYMYIERASKASDIIDGFSSQLERFRKEYGYMPKVILVKGIGLLAVSDSYTSAEGILDVFEDLMKISFYSEYFGGPRFMSKEQIEFIDNQEVDNYHKKVVSATKGQSVLNQKIVVVTGAAQGFGAGIAEMMFNENANLVIADMNQEKGQKMVADLNAHRKNNKALFVPVNVADDASVKAMVDATVAAFGGLDVFVSNAGILHAGSLEEMEPEKFELVTKVNYHGYFLCVRHASRILKIQSENSKEVMFDIIQINSKSGLKGSNKNFAYAGGKFGGIGLTQSFALELILNRIKVNSICPGNFFDGPLWSDPNTGLFVQYLRAGKVPGAKKLEDVKDFYEKQVPTGRGCTVEDVFKAVKYVVDQQYETGQAVPVTGGQNMLK